MTATPPIVIAIFAALLIASLVATIVVVLRAFGSNSLLAHARRLPVPWNGWHVLGAFACYMATLFLVAVVAAAILSQDRPIEDVSDLEWMRQAFVAQFIATAVSLGAFILISRPRPVDFGFPGTSIGRDLVIGGIAFLVVAPWLFLCKWLLSFLVSGDHPFFEMLSAEADQQFWLLAIVSIVVVAPIGEELFFRVILQGWLERVMGSRQEAVTAVAVGESEGGLSVPPLPGSTSASPPSSDLPIAGTGGASGSSAAHDDPFAPPATFAPAGEGAEPMPVVSPAPAIAWGPICVSSAIFAAVHIGNGPDPIPIFFLALVLGYLYQRTHRALPCIALHMVLNAFSLTVGWLQVGA
ncbi:MAG: CPBP family intramembrane metalloprotease [Planctomycetota bacterium]|nr:MAG: CPBP family intramembrane metalloprotease [Planctomycetota bacterium]